MSLSSLILNLDLITKSIKEIEYLTQKENKKLKRKRIIDKLLEKSLEK